MHLYTDEGDIDTTANHPFYVIGKGWVAAGDLVKGDEVYNLDGTTSIILGSEIEVLDEPVLVYNLEVEDFHSYFVGCVPVLVHNRCTLGKNMEAAGNLPPQDGKDYNAHHIFPQKFREFFESLGIDIDNPQFGIWLEEHEHLTNAYSYNKIWESEIEILKELTGIQRDQEFFRFLRGLGRLW